jgi:FKBP-type peptidyl-prolyl cis-trans isomerase (trigger factor)
MNTTLEKKPHCEVVVSGTLEVASIDAHFARALDRIVQSVELPGFRKGKVPKERVIQEVGDVSIWREAAEAALKDEIGTILKGHALIPMLPPSITLTVAAAQSDVPFTITVVTPPTVDIKDAKSSAVSALKKLEKLDEKKEKENALKSLDTQVRTMLQKTDETALTDDDAKKIGFENVKALDFFLDSEADRAVENYDNQRRRGAVAEGLLKDATIAVPLVFLKDEARAMLESTKQEIARQGLPFNEYLAKRGLTEEQVMEEMLPNAEKRVGLDLIFAKIADSESIKPDEAETHRVAHALMQQGAPEDRAHSYAAEMSIREKIWVILGVAAPAKPIPPAATEPVPEASPDTHDHNHDGHDHSDPNHTH